MTGRGTNSSKKRHSSQPLGGTAKDSRAEGMEEDNPLETNEIVDDSSTWSQVAGRGGGRGSFATSNRFGLLAQANSYPDKTMRSSSVTSRGSRRGGRMAPETVRDTQTEDQTQAQELTYSESSLGPRTLFVTPGPDGAYRDDFAIEFQQLNGKPFRGTITVREARDVIFKEILGFNPKLLHSIRPVFGGVVTIRFKLKEQIFLDSLAAVEYFELERRVSSTRTDVISCRIMGIRGLQAAPNYDGTANDVRWVKIENCEYAIEGEDILDWLRLYGEPLSLCGEDLLPDSDSDAGPLGNGTYSVKMKLAKDIPQFLPMHGRKIRIYFKNMNKLCTNCYGSHSRRQCTNERVPWVTYVRDFMKNNPDITENYYGKWWDVVDQEFPGYFDQQDEAQGDRQVQDTSSQVPRDDRHQTTASKPAPKATPQTRIQTNMNFSQRNQDEQNAQHQRQSRDPRVRKQQDDDDDLDQLVQKGLSREEAKNYLRNKKEQDQLEQRMRNLSTRMSNQTDERGVERTMSTRTGPGSSRGGRGGLTYN